MKKNNKVDHVVDLLIYTFLIGLAAVTIIPLLQVITVSISDRGINSSFGLHVLPKWGKMTLEGYKVVFGYNQIWTGYRNTLIRTLLGLVITMVLMVLGAYPLSKKDLPHLRFWTFFVVFTMYFKGGLIPSYILIKNLGMLNSMIALVLPPAISAFSLIILRNFFMTIPLELEESAKIEGAGPIRILVQVVLPLSKPVLATLSLWSVVFHWNEWFSCMIYIQDQSKWVLQYILRRILIEGQIDNLESEMEMVGNTDSMKMATLVISTLPIICTYPFLQKYFVKGVLVGSVKG